MNGGAAESMTTHDDEDEAFFARFIPTRLDHRSVCLGLTVRTERARKTTDRRGDSTYLAVSESESVEDEPSHKTKEQKIK